MNYAKFIFSIAWFALLLSGHASAQTRSEIFCNKVKERYPQLEAMRTKLNPIPKWCSNKDDSRLSCLLAKQRLDDANKCYSMPSIKPRQDIKSKGLCAQVKERFRTVEDMRTNLNPVPKWCADDKDARLSCALAKQRFEDADKCYSMPPETKNEDVEFCESARKHFKSIDDVAKGFTPFFNETCLSKFDVKSREECELLLKLMQDTFECMDE